MPVPATTPWVALLPTALAGTRRHPADPLPGLTPALGAEADAPEKQLLLTAANAALVQRAGRRPHTGLADDPGRAPVETLPPLTASTVELLTRLLTEEPWWRVRDGGVSLLTSHRLPPPALARLLRELPDLTSRWGLPGQLGGARGAWLVQNGYRTDRFQPTTLAQLTDAKVRERSLYVLGQQRPPGGWEWLLAALPHSKPRELRDLLYLLEHWATREAVPASLAPVLDRLFAHSDKRLWLPTVMARVPGSQLPEHHWAQAQRLLRRAPDTGELTLTLPDLNDPALAADVKLVESFNGGWRVMEKTLFHNYLRWVPLSHWAAHWHLEPAQVLELAARSPHASLLLDKWLETTANFGDVAAARALLARFRQQPWESEGSLKWLRQHLTAAVKLLPVAEQAAWRLSWLPAELPHAPVAPPSHTDHPLTWLEWATAHDSDPPPGLLLGLVPFMQAYFGQPPAPPSPVEAALARLLLDKVDRESPRLADAVEASLLPLARAQPTRPLGEAVLAVWPLLAFYRELAASLTAPATTLPTAKHPLP